MRSDRVSGVAGMPGSGGQRTGNHEGRRARPGLAGARLSFAVAIWTAAVLVTVLVAAQTRIGPVVLRLSGTHGLHLGDLVVAFGCALGAATLTALLPHRSGRHLVGRTSKQPAQMPDQGLGGGPITAGRDRRS
ncbi:MAG: hypothetical protein ACK5MT_21270 [Actinomycetales bacterium]